MRREALLGALISLTWVYDLPVLRSPEPAETARLLVYAAHQLQRHADGTLPRHGKRPRAKRRVQLRLLQGLPGVGPSRATELLERFGRVEVVMTASEESLPERGRDRSQDRCVHPLGAGMKRILEVGNRHPRMRYAICSRRASSLPLDYELVPRLGLEPRTN